MFNPRGGTPSRGYRDRGRGWRSRGAFSFRSNSGRSAFVPTPAPELGELLTEVQREDLELSPESQNAKITNGSYVASYNWLARQGKPTIVVPGTPPKWTPPVRTNAALPQDRGEFFRDTNSARFAKHPMQPAVEALLATKLDFKPDSIDLVACGSTLGNLLRFTRGEGKPFRIVVEAIADTVFFIRRENSPTELIPDVRGYGHSMPEAYTTWNPSVKGSESHQRIMKYSFGGLDCLVRFEADGYFATLVPEVNAQDPNTANSVNAEASAEAPLSKAFEKSFINAAAQSELDKPLAIIKSESTIVPQIAVFDLKTRSIKRRGRDFLSEELPRLWVAQIPNFILAFHDQGVFLNQNIEIKDMGRDLLRWERENEDALRKFSSLLHKIIGLAKRQSNGRLELCRAEDGPLEVREVGGDFNKCLPPEVEERWINGGHDIKGHGVHLH